MVVRVHLHGSLERSLGYADGEIGDRVEDWLGLTVDADREMIRSRLAAIEDEPEAAVEFEYRILCKDGSERWLVVNGRVSSVADGRPVRITGTYMDVTRRKESERALERAHATVARIGRVSALAQLSASISHELRQPLTAIAANASACLRWLAAHDASALTAVAIAPDLGERYLDTVYQSGWMEATFGPDVLGANDLTVRSRSAAHRRRRHRRRRGTTDPLSA